MDIKKADGFRFLPVDGPFSAGVAAEPRFDIVRVRMPHHAPLTKGFQMIEQALQRSHRPINALCALELRIPKQFNRSDWADFNAGYIAQWERWGAKLDGRIPGARTNVAPELEPPDGPSLHAFCYSMPSDRGGKDFVISGATEPGGTSGGLPGYWSAIARELETRMQALGVSWEDATETQLYATRADYEVFASGELLRFAEITRPGMRWFFSRPPIEGLNIEIDVRRLSSELWLSAEEI